MILWISNSGEGLPIAHRLQNEGEKVRAYIHHPSFEGNYSGIISKINMTDLPDVARKANLVVFDLVRPNGELKRDDGVLRLFNCDRNHSKVFGPVADKLRKRGIPVIGTSSMTEHLELDRQYGSTIAQKIGFKVPVTYNFNTLTEAQEFLENKNSLWVLKPHANQDLDLTYVESYPGELHQLIQNNVRPRAGDKLPVMLQKKIEGTALSTEGWFDGDRFVQFNHTLEDKSLMDGGLGPHIGSQSNTVWTRPEWRMDSIIQKLQKMEPVLREAGFVGPVDVNCLIADKNQEPYFLEWTPRFGYDAIQCLLTLLQTGVSDFFRQRFNVPFDDQRFACSQRLTIPPFPYEGEDLLRRAAGIEILEDEDDPAYWWQDVAIRNRDLQCAGADGIIGAVTGSGFSIGEAVNNVYSKTEGAKIGSYKQYRRDHAESHRAAFDKLPLGAPEAGKGNSGPS